MARRARKSKTTRPALASRAARGMAAADASRADQWRRAVIGLACLQTALFVLVIDPNAQDAFELPKAAVTHAVAWILLVALAVTVLRAGIAVPRSVLAAGIGLTVAADVAATVFAVDPYLALYGDRRYLGLTSQLTLVELAIAVAVGIQFRSGLRWLAAVTAGVAAVAAGYAALQWLGRDPFPWTVDPRARPFATTGNPDFYGQYLAVVLVTIVAAFVLLPVVRRGTTATGLAALGVVAAILVTVVATRGALIGIVAGGVALAVLWLRRNGLNRGTLLRFGAAAAAALAASVIIIVATPIGARLGGLVQGSFGDRVLLFGSALAMWRDHPILGVGPENLSVVYGAYRQPEVTEVLGRTFSQTSAHNFVLQTAATTGLIGLTALAVVLAAAAYRVWRSARDADGGPRLAAGAALAAYYGCALVLPASQSIEWIPWTCIGVILAPDVARVEQGPRFRIRVPTAVAVAALVAAAILASLEWGPVDASEGAGRGVAAIRAKAVDTGITLTRRATQLDPSRASHWFALGQALEAAHDTAGARTAYLEAARRRPDELPFWWGLSRTNIDLAAQGVPGAAAAAVDAAKRGIAADALDPNGYDQLARAQLLAAGDNAAAIESARHAIALYPRDPGYYLVAAEATRRAGDVAGSITWLRQGVAATEDADLRLNLARALIATAQTAEARAVLEALLKRDPTSGAALDLLRQLPAP